MIRLTSKVLAMARHIGAAAKNSHHYAVVAATVPIIAAAALAVAFAFTGSSTPRAGVSRAAVMGAAVHMSVPFVSVSGRQNPNVGFYAQSAVGTAYVTRSGLLVESLPPPPGAGRPGEIGRGWTLVERPVSKADLKPAGVGKSATRISIFHGRDPAKWLRNLSSFSEVSLGQPWPGIRLAYRARGDGVERVFQVAAGASASTIRMQLSGARSLGVHDGRLVAETGLGPVELSKPVAYQEIDGLRRFVDVGYRVSGDTYGFWVGSHDPGHSLVIDPILRVSYLGGSGYDDSYAIAFAPDGTVYVTGQTYSNDFPGTAGGAEPYMGQSDVFVARFNSDLTALLQATYLGGSARDVGQGVAVNSKDNVVYVVGGTSSQDFPRTNSGAQPNYGGGDGDAFVAALSVDLTRLFRSSYLGGTGKDNAWALGMGPDSQAVYLAGYTDSENFPDTAGGAQSVYGGGVYDGFVSVFNAYLTQVNQSTYVGGSGKELLFGLAVSPHDGVYVGGGTYSTDLPNTVGSAQPQNNGGEDAFVTRLSPNLRHFRSTYLGGSGNDEGRALAWSEMKDCVYIVGQTQSTDFPVSAGAPQAVYGGGSFDGIVARLNPKLTKVQAATYIGGSGQDQVRSAVAVSPIDGTVYLAGSTWSLDFPGAAGGVQDHCRDGHSTDCDRGDAFVARYSPQLRFLLQSTYLGGNLHDGGHGLAIDPATGQVYLTFGTASGNLLHTQDAAQQTYGGGIHDGTVAVLPANLRPPN